ncbi:hypothetical protein B7R54_16855 [Subtercola boreus]|uniref:FAD-binding FR-type domain-containing protein n=1 Tax=Subtercola boreus TaxID=120213 RepID=A0A3E0VMK3_9MICO|nr:siderophore-interacting protein [Subtercola boreus]RFA10688.1 hypothetical protein B7R54_16855 [Subtercola boreus]TQL55751.1 NADPH-dependent ferric siderophore reductase [Subtercola boreus]
MARYPRLMPTDPQLFSAVISRSERLSPSFQRVTITGDTLSAFEWTGFDHWFRLFLPPVAGSPLHLPAVTGRGWYKHYLAIPEETRPHCSNYTVADFRTVDGRTELDIDVVIHRDAAGEVTGGVAIWATTAAVGSPVALLDQGPMFDPPADLRGVHLVSDESGLPALRGILRDLDPGVTGTAIIEVPSSADVETLRAPAGVEVTWVVRGGAAGHPSPGSSAETSAGAEDAAAAPSALRSVPAGAGPARHHARADRAAGHPSPGHGALEALRAKITPHPHDYAFIVGESTLATEGRRALHRAGLPKSRITFSGFWKHAPAAH